MSVKVILITSGQPALNPRLVKEADTLTELGFEVLVIYAYWNEWGSEMSERLLASKNWKAILAGGDPRKQPWTYLWSRLIFRTSNILVKKLKWLVFADTATTRAGFHLEKAAKRLKADLYIGHNIGALPALIKAAKKHQRPCGFDAEDFHRHEFSKYGDRNPVSILKAYLENKYIPQVTYLSTSSPEIAQAYQRLFPELTPITLMNAFPTVKLPVLMENKNSMPLKLFWFSQTIGMNRGLEDVISALTSLPHIPIELHLLGYQPPGDPFIKYLRESGINISFYQPINPTEIILFAAKFDIGLALEPGFSVNNDLALSNKLFTYIMAGLTVLASDTTAQSGLLLKYPAIGELYPKNNSNMLAKLIARYHENRDLLFQKKHDALEVAQKYLNWEQESLKFSALIRRTIL